MIRVLVADDQPLLAEGIATILDVADDIEVVAQARNGQEAVERAASARPDVALMDIQMPVMDGIEATRRLTAMPQPARVIILTTFDIDQYVFEAVQAGASAFLLKDIARHQLVEAVRRVHAGDALVSPTITRKLMEAFVQPRTDPAAARSVAALSQREVEVLRAIAQGLSNSEIAEKLFVSQSTIKTHVAHVLAKLRVRDRVHAVVVAYESGLMVPGRPAP